MTVFICHSSRDDAAVRTLVQHLQAARETVWLDQSLSGGEAWWSRILNQIRSCAVFVVALSNNSLQSKPCRAEMGYAKSLGLPILPVQIGDVDSYRIDPIFTMQSVDYRNPDVTTGMALIAALHERAAERKDLPDPLPEPPPIPYEYLQRFGVRIDSPEELSSTEQSTILLQLRRALHDEDEEGVRDDIRRLLRALRRRSEVTYAIATEIDGLLSTAPTTAQPHAQAHTEAGESVTRATPAATGRDVAPPRAGQPTSSGQPPLPPPRDPSQQSLTPSAPSAQRGRGFIPFVVITVVGVAAFVVGYIIHVNILSMVGLLLVVVGAIGAAVSLFTKPSKPTRR